MDLKNGCIENIPVANSSEITTQKEKKKQSRHSSRNFLRNDTWGRISDIIVILETFRCRNIKDRFFSFRIDAIDL